MKKRALVYSLVFYHRPFRDWRSRRNHSELLCSK
jgi:hypothetical protein